MDAAPPGDGDVESEGRRRGCKKGFNEHTMAVNLEAVLTRENLRAAWAAVKGNRGSAGVDRKSIRRTEEHLKQHWPAIRAKLLAGTYRPAAVRGVEIPKASGGTRRLGIPTVQDRLIQQALHQVMSAAFDGSMSDHSYGFRPNRSAHDAIDAARAHVREGKIWMVDIDLKSFFDQVNHDRLMHLLRRRIADKQVLKLIGGYLRAPIQGEDGRRQPRPRGTPQGGPLSPLLANIYLTPLDEELTRRGIAFVRYADDIALFLSSERAAQRALVAITAWLKKTLDLEVSATKSGAGKCEDTQLLGFRIHEGGEVSPSPKAIAKLKERVRELWTARQNATSEELRDHWQRYITGWWNYFGYANWRREVIRLSGWIRRHMRKCFWQRWHDGRGRYNALKRLGVTGRGLWLAASSCGAWRMARNPVLHQALGTSTLNRFGFNLPWELASA